MRLALIPLLFPLFAIGCFTARPEHLPTYHWTGAPAALSALCTRSHAVRTVSAETALTLTRSNGDSVRLDGAIVMQPPASVRMRAWKFSQAVFDLTLTPAGLWIESPPDPDRREKILPASVNAGKMARAWAVVSGEFFCNPSLRIEDRGGARFRVEGRIEGQRLICEIERATLTPRRYMVLDSAGVIRFVLTMERYEVIQGIVWPVRLKAESDGGTILIDLKEVELNQELAPGAFIPPRRAEKIP